MIFKAIDWWQEIYPIVTEVLFKTFYDESSTCESVIKFIFNSYSQRNSTNYVKIYWMLSEAFIKMFYDESNCMLKCLKIGLKNYSQRRSISRYFQRLLIFLNNFFGERNSYDSINSLISKTIHRGGLIVISRYIKRLMIHLSLYYMMKVIHMTV